MEQGVRADAATTELAALQRLNDVMAAFESTAGTLEVAGRQLVATLRDELADGQGETLLSVERASAGVQRRTLALESAAAAAARDIRMLLLEMPGSVDEAVRVASSGLAAQVDGALVLLGDQLAAVSERTAEVARAASAQITDSGLGLRAATDETWVQLLAMTTRVTEEGQAAVARVHAQTQAGQQAMADAARNTAEGVSGRIQALLADVGVVTGAAVAEVREAERAVAATAERAEGTLRSTGDWLTALAAGVVGQVQADVASVTESARMSFQAEVAAAALALRQAGERAAQLVDRSADATLSRLEDAREQLVQDVGQQADAVRSGADCFLADLAHLLAKWEAQETRRDARVDARVGRLVDRAAAMLAEASGRLDAETERLRHVDSARAEEVARVLEDVRARTSLRTPRLRDRVLRARDSGPSAAEPARRSGTPEPSRPATQPDAAPPPSLPAADLVPSPTPTVRRPPPRKPATGGRATRTPPDPHAQDDTSAAPQPRKRAATTDEPGKPATSSAQSRKKAASAVQPRKKVGSAASPAERAADPRAPRRPKDPEEEST